MKSDFHNLVALVQELEFNDRVNSQLREWFVTRTRVWLEGVGEQSLNETLGVKRRYRREYLIARQSNYLQAALSAFVRDRSQSPWKLAIAFVSEIKKFESVFRPDMASPESDLRRNLYLAFRLPLKIPNTREHWNSQIKTLKLTGVCVSVDACDAGRELNPHDPFEESGEAAMIRRKGAKGPVHVRTDAELHNAIFAGLLPDEVVAIDNPQLAQHIATSLANGNKFAPLAPRSDGPVADQDARSEFANSPALQAEFRNEVEDYVAYRRAVGQGRVQYVGGRRS